MGKVYVSLTFDFYQQKVIKDLYSVIFEKTLWKNYQ